MSQIAGEELLLTEPEAAKLLALCARTVYELRQRGELPYVRVGKKLIRYPISGLKAWVEKNTQAA